MLVPSATDLAPAMVRADALDAPVRFLPGWRLDLRCAACGEAFAVELDGLDRERRMGATVRDVANRASCPRCGTAPARAELVPAGQERAGSTLEHVPCP